MKKEIKEVMFASHSMDRQFYNSLIRDIKIDKWLKEHLPDEIQRDLLLVSDRIEEEGSPMYLTVYLYPKRSSLLADLPENEWSYGGFYLEKDDFFDGDGISLEYIISDHSNKEDKSYCPQDVYNGLVKMVTELKKIYTCKKERTFTKSSFKWMKENLSEKLDCVKDNNVFYPYDFGEVRHIGRKRENYIIEGTVGVSDGEQTCYLRAIPIIDYHLSGVSLDEDKAILIAGDKELLGMSYQTFNALLKSKVKEINKL